MVATDSLNVLETTPPRFTPEEVAAIAAELFGLARRGARPRQRARPDLHGRRRRPQDLEHRRGSSDPRPRGEGARAHRARRPRAADRAPARPPASTRATSSASSSACRAARARGISTTTQSATSRPRTRASRSRCAGSSTRRPGAISSGIRGRRRGSDPSSRRSPKPAGGRSSSASSTATRSASFRAGTSSRRRSCTATSRSTTCWSTRAGASPGSPTSATSASARGRGIWPSTSARSSASAARSPSAPRGSPSTATSPGSRSRTRSSTSSATSSSPGWRRWSPSAPGAWSAIPRTPSTSSPGTTSHGRCSSSSTTLGFDDVAHELGASRVAATGELLQRRSQVLGSALTGLTYREPVHVVRGEGVWLFDAQGRRLLDCYNNVPVVGHCHPRVTEAVVRQTRLLNTHSRYLYEPLVELAERLVATMPPETGLDAVMLVNSGSEANDLAWRLATTATGHRGAIVTEFAYHGVTTAIADFSPEEWPQGFKPEHVETIAPPGAGREVDVAGAAARLDAARFGPRRDVSGLRLHERRHLDSCCRGGAGDRARDARGRRPGRRRRGAGGPRAERGAPVVVRAVRHRAGRRHAREADGERLPGRRGDRAAGALRPPEGGDGGLLDVRRQPGGGAGCAGRAGRDRGRAARRARAAGGGGAHRGAARSRASAKSAAAGCWSASSSSRRS